MTIDKLEEFLNSPVLDRLYSVYTPKEFKRTLAELIVYLFEEENK